jgi:hypothetical protein
VLPITGTYEYILSSTLPGPLPSSMDHSPYPKSLLSHTPVAVTTTDSKASLKSPVANPEGMGAGLPLEFTLTASSIISVRS